MSQTERFLLSSPVFLLRVLFTDTDKGHAIVGACQSRTVTRYQHLPTFLYISEPVQVIFVTLETLNWLLAGPPVHIVVFMTVLSHAEEFFGQGQVAYDLLKSLYKV